MTRISLDPPGHLRLRATQVYARRRVGAERVPVRAMAHSPRVLRSYLALERGAHGWRDLDPWRAILAVMGPPTPWSAPGAPTSATGTPSPRGRSPRT